MTKKESRPRAESAADEHVSPIAGTYGCAECGKQITENVLAHHNAPGAFCSEDCMEKAAERHARRLERD